MIYLTPWFTLHHILPCTIFYITPWFTLHHVFPYTIFFITPYFTLHHIFTLYHILPYTMFYLTPYFTLHHVLPYIMFYFTPCFALHHVLPSAHAKDSGAHLHLYKATGRFCRLLCFLQGTKLCDLLADEQEEFLGSVWLLLRTSFWSIFQPPGLLLSQETDKGAHEHRRKKRPEYSCAPNSWEVAREEKNLKYFLSRISLLSSIFLLRVDNWFKAAPTPHARPRTPARSWCKPWADGAVQWKIRSLRKHRAKNKTPSSRKLHGLFQDKKKNWDPWAKIRILLQSGVFHFYELPRSLLIEETSIPSQLKAHLICCLSVHWSAFSRLPRDCSLLN